MRLMAIILKKLGLKMDEELRELRIIGNMREF